MKKELFSAMLFLSLLLTGCGDKSDGSGGTLYTAISQNPKNLDPQMAEDSISKSVICNIFEGLVELDGSGAVRCGAAEDYEISEDGTVYTFHLRKGMKWSSADGFTAEVTANDFVYAFRRIFMPSMLSPYTDDFSCLKNSGKVYEGIMSSADLGVKALDDYTVQFTLEYPVSDFLYMLTTSAAMPCNEEFFLQTNGRYGLDERFCAGNGAFTLDEWNYDPYWNENFLKLSKCPDNSTEEHRIYPRYVNFIITDDPEAYEKENKITFNASVCKAADLPVMRGKTGEEYPCRTAGVTFDPKNKTLMNGNIRFALAAAADGIEFDTRDISGIASAAALVPQGSMIKNKSIRELISESSKPVFSSESMTELWQQGLSETEFGETELISVMVSEEFAGAQNVYLITDRWQRELGFSCGIEIVSQREYDRRYSDGDYDMALTVIECDSVSAIDFLEEYTSYIYNQELSKKADTLLYGARHSVTLSETVDLCNTAENEIMSSAYFIPMYYESDFLIQTNGTEGVIYDPFSKTLNFREAKVFD